MRMYGNSKILRSKIERRVSQKAETRDAILWEINQQQRLCRVKIQGSSELITAAFPQNWEEAPVWLKTGNAVRITHTGGNRSRIELVGHGQYIPTPQAGESQAPAPGVFDGILSGGLLTAGGGMSVDVSGGTFRLGENTFNFSGDTVAIGTAPGFSGGDPYWRYDLIVAGEDGTVDVIEGTPSTTAPAMPTVPANHIQLGWVSVYGDIAQISRGEINSTFPGTGSYVPTSLIATVEDGTLDWTDLSTTITVDIKNQFGGDVNADHSVKIEFMSGNGTLSYGGDNSTTSLTEPITDGHTITFTYTRDQLVTDGSPTFKITELNSGLQTVASVTLLDADGNIMPGEAVGGGSGGPIVTNASLTLVPEYAGAVMTPSGSNNDPGGEGMTSDLWTGGNSAINYYEWLSDIATGLQSYDIFVQIPIPTAFKRFQTGTSQALTLDICTEENTTTNNKIDITLQKDGSATTSSLTGQKSASAGQWETVGFDETDSVLSILTAEDLLNVRIRMYSQNTKYSRVGKINLAIMQ